MGSSAKAIFFKTLSGLAELNKVVAQYASTRPYITKVYLMDKNRKIITPELRGEQVDKFLNITKNGKILNISPLHKAGYVSGTAKVFSVAKLIYAYNDRTEPLGTIVADIDCKVLEEALGDYALPLDGRMILLNENGEVLLNKSGKDVQWENSSRKSSSEYVTISEQSQVTGWTLSAQIPRGEFIRSIISQMWLSFAVLIFCLAVIVLVSRKIIHSVYQPLNLLTESMKTVEQGNFDTKIEYNQKDEFWYIYFGYDWFVVLDDLDTLQQTLVKKVPESDADKNEDRKVLFFRLKYISEHEYIDQHEAKRIKYPPQPVQIGIGNFGFQLGFRRIDGIFPVLLHVIPKSFKHKIRSYIFFIKL
mgnify:FL=1